MEFVPQPGVALGGSNIHAVPQATALLVGQLTEGGVVSITVINWQHSLERPQLSVIRQHRMTLKVSPQKPEELVMVEMTVTVPAELVGGLKASGLPHSTVLFGAQTMIGGWALTVSVAQLVTVLQWPVTRTQ
jgi:hypothetical protein